VGLRVDEQAEFDGADISEHGERGYSDIDLSGHTSPERREPASAAGAPALRRSVEETA
jgi:hypothetical protein